MVTYRAASLGKTVDPNYLVRYGRKRWTGYIDDSDFSAFAACATGATVPLDVQNPPVGCVP